MNEQKQIKDLTIIELKSNSFDILRDIETRQNILRVLQEELVRKEKLEEMGEVEVEIKEVSITPDEIS